jgi:rhodanese-related sulfurtransferase
VARILMKNGFTKVYVLDGGWHKWLEAKYPTESK